MKKIGSLDTIENCDIVISYRSVGNVAGVITVIISYSSFSSQNKQKKNPKMWVCVSVFFHLVSYHLLKLSQYYIDRDWHQGESGQNVTPTHCRRQQGAFKLLGPECVLAIKRWGEKKTPLYFHVNWSRHLWPPVKKKKKKNISCALVKGLEQLKPSLRWVPGRPDAKNLLSLHQGWSSSIKMDTWRLARRQMD